jgi:hypothetical protein
MFSAGALAALGAARTRNAPQTERAIVDAWSRADTLRARA